MADWSKDVGIDRGILSYRLKVGMTPEEAVNAPIVRKTHVRT
jgi:hypothetical protein